MPRQRESSSRVGRRRPRRASRRRAHALLHAEQRLGDGEEADDHCDEVHAAEQRRRAEREATHARHRVQADEGHEGAQGGGAEPLHQRRPRQAHDHAEGEDHEAEVLGRADPQGEVGEGRREEREADEAECPRHEGRDRGDGEGRPGPALPRHLIAVHGGDHRGHLARHVDEDGGGRAAVHGAVVDGGEHDDGRRRRQERCERQQDGDARGGPDAGQHADQRPQDRANQSEEEVLRRERLGEALEEEADGIHARSAAGRRRAAHCPKGPDGRGIPSHRWKTRWLATATVTVVARVTGHEKSPSQRSRIRMKSAVAATNPIAGRPPT